MGNAWKFVQRKDCESEMMQRVPGYYEPTDFLNKRAAPQAMRFLVTKHNDRALQQDVKTVGQHQPLKVDPGMAALTLTVKS